MKTPILILTAAASAVALSSGAASAAQPPVVSAQHVYAGSRSPVSIPGTGIRRGDKLPAGSRIVFRTVTIASDQKARATLTATGGRKLRGLGVREGTKVSFAVVGSGNYVGKTKVTVRAYPTKDGSGSVSGRIYALTR